MPVVGDGFRCEAFDRLIAPNPALIAIVPTSEGPCEKLAQQAAGAIRTALVRMAVGGAGATAPCGGRPGGAPDFCFAHGEPSCRKVLVLVSDGKPFKDFSGAIQFWSDAIVRGDRQYVVVPASALRDRSSTLSHLPSTLGSVNMFCWAATPSEVASSALRAAGIAPDDHRVFISYRRSDGQAHANRLFDRLTKQGFDVFLDRTGIQPGALITDRIREQLSRYSFLVVLETPEAALSSWVAQEVGFAARYRLGILAVNFPGAPKNPAIGRDRRIMIDRHDVDSRRRLRVKTLDRLCEEIHLRHDRWLVRRRYQLLQALRNELLYHSVFNQRSTPAGVLEACYGNPARKFYRVWATPRVPELADFFHLDSDMPSSGGMTSVVGPSSQPFSSNYQALLWLSSRTGIALHDESNSGHVAKLISTGRSL